MTTYLSVKIKRVSLMAILMVVFIHSYSMIEKYVGSVERSQVFDFNFFIQDFISQGIARVAVPLFFLISGYLFFRNFKLNSEKLKHKYKSRFWSLAVPYVLWNTWGVVFLFLLQSVPASKQYFAEKLVSDYSIMDFANRILVDPIPYQLWFLRDLIIYVLVSPLIYLLVKKTGLLPVLVAFGLWLFRVDIPFIDVQGISFFVFGSFLALRKIPVEKRKSPIDLYIFFAWLGVNSISAIIGPDKFETLFNINIIVGVYAVWFAYDWIELKIRENGFWDKISNYTFFIFAFHIPVLSIIKALILKVLDRYGSVGLLATYIIGPIAVVSIALLIGLFLRKYLKPFYSLITGGRG